MAQPTGRPVDEATYRADRKRIWEELAQIKREAVKPTKIPPPVIAGGLAIGVAEAESSGFGSNPGGADLNTWNIKPYDWIPNSRPPALTADGAYFRVVESGWYMLSVQMSFALSGDVPLTASALIRTAGDAFQVAADTTIPTHPSGAGRGARAYISTQPAYLDANAGVSAGVQWAYGHAVTVQSGYGYFYIVRIA